MPSKAENALAAKQFIEKLKKRATAAELKKYERYFPPEKRNGDVFIGVRMGHVFELAKEFIDMPPEEIEKLLESKIHEVRAGACSIMGKSGSSKKTPESRVNELYELYIRRHDRVNNWDLVDLAAHQVVGRYLADKPRKILYTLARSKNQWERRTAIISTAHFIWKKEVDDALKIAEILVRDKEEFVQKAVGWMLRFVGDKDRKQLVGFLDKHAAKMPRVMLRNSIEHFSKKEWEHYLSLGKEA
ncbi:MAG: DNA alkylation repair protein [Ignavibacteriae bacterium]|nr:DNA alkylation repair protein [Ignavibacteriota bacterium]